LRREKDSNTGTIDDNTPENTEDQEAPIEPTSEQDDWEDGKVNPDDPVRNEVSEDSNYLPISEEDESLGDEDFIIPKEHLEQERFKRRLIATARSLKKKQQQLQADQDLLNDSWTNVLAAKEYDLKIPIKSYPKRRLLSQFTTRSWNLYRQRVMLRTDLTNHPMTRTEGQTQAEHQTAAPRPRGKETIAAGYTYDL